MTVVLFVLFLQLLYIPEETKAINVNVNGFIELEPKWLFAATNKIARTSNHSVNIGEPTRKHIEDTKTWRFDTVNVAKGPDDYEDVTSSDSKEDSSSQESKNQNELIEDTEQNENQQENVGKKKALVTIIKNREATDEEKTMVHQSDEHPKKPEARKIKKTTVVTTKDIERMKNIYENKNKQDSNSHESKNKNEPNEETTTNNEKNHQSKRKKKSIIKNGEVPDEETAIDHKERKYKSTNSNNAHKQHLRHKKTSKIKQPIKHKKKNITTVVTTKFIERLKNMDENFNKEDSHSQEGKNRNEPGEYTETNYEKNENKHRNQGKKKSVPSVTKNGDVSVEETSMVHQSDERQYKSMTTTNKAQTQHPRHKKTSEIKQPKKHKERKNITTVVTTKDIERLKNMEKNFNKDSSSQEGKNKNQPREQTKINYELTLNGNNVQNNILRHKKTEKSKHPNTTKLKQNITTKVVDTKGIERLKNLDETYNDDDNSRQEGKKKNEPKEDKEINYEKIETKNQNLINGQASDEKAAMVHRSTDQHHKLTPNVNYAPKQPLRLKKISKIENKTTPKEIQNITRTVLTTKGTEKLKNMDDYFNIIARIDEVNSGEQAKLSQVLHKTSVLNGRPHDVKEDNEIKEFTAHVYKEALRTLKDIKNMLNKTKMMKRVDEMTQGYKDKFADFVNETLKQKIKTRLGAQKVVLNTIEVSNRMLRTIANTLKVEIDKQKGKGNLREYDGISNTKLYERVDNQADLEYLHACQNLGICRWTHGFSQFLAAILTEVLKNDDKKVRQFSDSISEVIKYANLRDIVDNTMKKDLNKKLTYIENLDPLELRSTYQTLRNMLVSQNRPFTVYIKDKRVVKKSLALRELIDVFDQKILPTTENKKEWNNMILMMKEWTLGQKDNVQEVVKKIVKQMLRKGIGRMGPEGTVNVQEKLAILLKSDF